MVRYKFGDLENSLRKLLKKNKKSWFTAKVLRRKIFGLCDLSRRANLKKIRDVMEYLAEKKLILRKKFSKSGCFQYKFKKC